MHSRRQRGGECCDSSRSCQHALDDVTIATIDGRCFPGSSASRTDGRATARDAIASTNVDVDVDVDVDDDDDDGDDRE
ncbi:Uncharacterized protein DBV15_01168 [Temnothorax longispinosus]|uniref:Uncharacterized protein n=1 Tax=Temnothorax longispinosus TaxID=300112 RepID=A0A4S2J9H3_9HYME|nr:Uncharacterized protein DBV15_01168 [Temnothorax longispinosus]